MSTKLCQEYLVKKFASWADERYGVEAQKDMIQDAMTASIIAEMQQCVAAAHKPSGWTRVAKYKVGSKVDIHGGAGDRSGNNLAAEFPRLIGWTCRVFLLKYSDSIEIALFEKDGVISKDYFDFSD